MTEEQKKACEKIAYLVSRQGGRAYYVGGFVRDKLLGIENKDVDIEVHGIEPGALFELLGRVGEPLVFGESFGIFSLKGLDIDIAMPRKERAVGRGHRDFQVFVDPFIGTLAAAARRDFTVNALMEDVLTGEIIDHFEGRRDLEAGVLRHIKAETFVEDPLRVLRGAQFASRFGFTVAEDTVTLCKTIDLSYLPKERVEEELKKALLKGEKPSVFFEVLKAMDSLDLWFPEIKALIGVGQDPVFHPEGDVWNHTMEVLDRAAALRSRAKELYPFMLLCLLHDLGKTVTTSCEKGRIHAYGHETAGTDLIDGFLDRIVSDNHVKAYVKNMIPLHMKPNVVAWNRSSLKTTNHMFDEAICPEDLILFASADKPVMSGESPFGGDEAFLLERLGEYRKTMEKPFVMGRDLLEAGLTAGPDFSELLDYAHKLRLAGVKKEDALKQVLAMASKNSKKRPGQGS